LQIVSLFAGTKFILRFVPLDLLKNFPLTENPKNRDYWQLLWLKFKDGDRDSFGEIYHEFADKLFSYGSKIASDRELLKDCIQDLFVDLYKYRPDLRNPELLEFYLYKSLKRLIIRRLQKDRLLESIHPASNSFELTFNAELDGYQDDSKNEQMELLQKALKSLDEKKRELLFLKFDSELSYLEIGLLLNMKPETAKKQVYRIVRHLHRNFGSTILDLVFIPLRKN